jgi:hypothetical protein
MRGFISITSALLLMLIPASPAGAQSTDAGPALGVARISLINGDVTTKRGDSGDWVSAQVNEPVVEGDFIETAPGSRIELQLDYSNVIRLDGAASVEITELGNKVFRVRLLEGRLTYSELKGGEADIDIETPLAAVRPRERGRYEVEVRGGETIVQVRRGRTEIASVNGLETLGNGRMAVIRDQGPGAGPEILTERAQASDAWDDWNRSRDNRLEDVTAYRYVSQDIVGAADLDDHGDWQYVSGYGHCWYPRGVGVGWAPYRSGRWMWADYYGWNWVGYEPWGWAPYHYGRWFHTPGLGWGWWPGYRHHRHFYQPALVSFFGWGGGRGFSVGVGIGFGHVGWVPLAPGELYRPWYGRGFYGGRNRVNNTIIVDNSVNIYNNYRNARANNGVTVVDANGFSRGQLNNPTSLRGEELQRASLIRGQIPVAPTREAQGRVVRASARGQNSQAARQASSSGVRSFARSGDVAATRSARLERSSFDQQRQQVVSSVRSFRNERAGFGAAPVAGNVRTGSDARGAMSGAQAPSRGAGSSSVRRSAGASAVRGGAAATTRAGGWRASDSRVGTTRASGRQSVTQPSSRSRATGRAAGSSDVRSSGRLGVVPGSDAGSRSRVTGTSRVDRGGTIPRSNSRVRSEASAPLRTGGRVDRGGAAERSNSRVRFGVSAPQRTGRRIESGSRVDRAPSASRSIPSTASPGRGGSYGGGSYGGGSVGRTPRMSSPSRSSAPTMRSPGGGMRSGGGVRSAPSGIGRSGGGVSRSSGGVSRSGGGVRSAPSSSRSSGRGR